MKVVVVSEDFRSISGKAGKARRFLVFEAARGARPVLERYYELPADAPTYHDLHDDDTTPFPFDGMELITGEAGVGFSERLLRRGTRVHITDERDPLTAVALLMSEQLPSKAPTPQDTAGCS